MALTGLTTFSSSSSSSSGGTLPYKMRTDTVVSLFKPAHLPWKPVGDGNILSRFMRSSSCCSSSSLPARFRVSSVAVDDDRGDLQSEETILDIEEKPMREYSWADPKKPRICILGGGFGGLYSALRLESLVWPPDKKPQILIIDQSDRFVFKPMMYELLSKEVELWEVAPLFKDLLAGTFIQFQKDKVEVVFPCDGKRPLDTDRNLQSKDIGGTVLLESGMKIEYDWLIQSLGAESKRDSVPGAIEYALPFSSLEDVLAIERQLKKLERERFATGSLIQLVVVGGGYTGVELAATLAERLGDRGKVQIVNVAPDICPSAPSGNREAAYKVLSSRNVELILGFFATAIKRSPSEGESRPYEYVLELMSASKATKRSGLPSMSLPADLIFWTVGSKPSLPSGGLGGSEMATFPLNGRGQLETDDTLRVKGHPRIFAIGDSAFLRDSSGQPLPTTAQVALQEADYAGWNLWAAINDRPLLPFRYQNLGEMMSLGKNDGAVSVSFIDGLTLDGPLGHTARKLAYLYRLPTNEHRLKVGVSWFMKSAVDAVASVQDTLTKMVL